jgi:hypothetical protein
MKEWKKGELAHAWKRLRQVADQQIANGVVAFDPPSFAGDTSRLWERTVGNAILTVAFCYLLDGNVADREFAFAQARAAAAYPEWGAKPIDDLDLPAAHLLFGLGVLLDWLGSEMDAATRNQMIAALRVHGNRMAVGAKTAFWSKEWLQNHLWVNMTGLLAASIALEPYAPHEARGMISISSNLMQRCWAVMQPDGSSQEGPAYWEYGAEYLLKFHHLATEVLGLSLPSLWLKNTASYRAAMTLPMASVSSSRSILNAADSNTTGWYGPEYLLRRLASLNRDEVAQELAERLEARGAVSPTSPWLNFIWFDPSVPAQGLSDLPALQYFNDLDLVVARSDRSGSEAAVVMRCGPPMGKAAQAAQYPVDAGVGHVHPDINHVTLFAEGQFLLIDDGYAAIKQTHQHNTLIVNQMGQVGEGQTWLRYPAYPIPDPQPEMIVAESKSTHDYWIGRGAAAYPAASGLKRFDRHVIFLKPDILVVIDDLAANAIADFSLLWHPGATLQDEGNNSYSAKIFGSVFHMDLVLPATARTVMTKRNFPLHDGGSQTMDELQVILSAASAQCAAVFSWAAKGSVPAVARAVLEGDLWTITSGSRKYSLDLAERRLRTSGDV